ncbi:EamA-like transporter family [Microvirga lotononidis]|uniref:EamA-like transporter family n=1 Tax=Microvirga lotononidis TaxID=864069 RepID=I4YQT3_9HYPH|nr:EamA-like transporter family [Microvirga lotononidis]
MRGNPAIPSAAWNRWVAFRAGCEAAAAGFLIVAVTHLPITLVTGVLMTVPLLVTVLGKAILNEHASRGIWIAISIGFAGTLLLLRPGLDLSPLGLTSAGLSALCFAGRDVTTRHLPRLSGALRLTLTANAATLTPGLALTFVQLWDPPSQDQILTIAVGVLLYVASNVRQWGLRLRERVGFKRAAVAMARKLAVVMHTMLRTGEFFDRSASTAA